MISGTRAVRLGTKTDWLHQLCWGHKTPQRMECDAMQSVMNYWRSSAFKANADNIKSATAAIVATATRGRLPDSSDDEERGPVDDADILAPSDETCGGTKWVTVRVAAGRPDTIRVYPCFKSIFVEAENTVLEHVVSAFQQERRCLKGAASGDMTQVDPVTAQAWLLLSVADTDRITWSYSRKAFMLHYNLTSINPTTKQPSIGWCFVPLSTPTMPDDDTGDIENTIQLTLSVARHKWNTLDKSGRARYEAA